MIVYAHHIMNKKGEIIVVVGPTASGKSDFAVELAKKVDGEIISADSRQVYKGLDIGTGKITQEEMQGVPHYMLDVIDPGEPFSVAEYKRLAQPILEDIIARGKTPIVCGGTGQYIDALMYTAEPPKIPPHLALRKELESKTTEELFTELSQKDPNRAMTIDKHNKVRLVRALEIIDAIGNVPPLPKAELTYDVELYLMHPTRELLRERIEKRLTKRLESGMLAECEQLLTQGVTHEELERLGLEYRYMSRYLRREISYDEMKEQLKNKIVQYAKRQDTWNKKYLPFAKIVEVTQ